MEIPVLYEDKDVVVVNKPAGILVHGIYDKNGPKHTGETLVDWLAEKYPETKNVGDPKLDGKVNPQRGGIVHRLDRDTSGVLVVARNQKAFEYLKKSFQGRSVKKTYIALVWGRIHELKGIIDKPISIKDGTVKRTVFAGKMTREAVTAYETIAHYNYAHGKHRDELTLVKAMPKTGRTHQIRVHFSSIGHEIYGDKLYGKKRDTLELGRQFLHAAEIELKLPGETKISIEAPLPPELENLLVQLEKSEV
jgi:23S rRNA pseudouridine1911/1915/1917 synthase